MAFTFTRALVRAEFLKPSVLETIGEGAFSVSGLEAISLPESLQELQQFAFSECLRLESLSFGEFSCASFARGSFQSINISAIHIPDSITTIHENAFMSCSFLRSVTFSPESRLQEIGGLNRTSIETISIPNGVVVIGPHAFKACHCLLKVEFGVESSLVHIKEEAFWLSSVRLVHPPRSLKRVERFAFADCVMLCHISFSESLTDASLDNCVFGHAAHLSRTFVGLSENFLSHHRTVYHLRRHAVLSQPAPNEG
jgi:hypothetical protein